MIIKVEVGTLVTYVTVGSIVLNVTGSTHELVDLSGDSSGSPVAIRRKDNQQLEIASVPLTDFKQPDGTTALLTETGIDGFNELEGILFDNNALESADIKDFTAAVQAAAGSGSMPATGDPGTPSDATVSPIIGKSFGDVQGKSVAEALMLAWFPSVVPPQSPPALAFTSGTLLSALAGDDISAALTWLFTDNASQGKDSSAYRLVATPDIGSPITLNPVDSASGETLDITDFTSRTVVTLEGDYLEGLVPQDNYGNDQPSSKLPAGTAMATFTITPFWRTHHGLVAQGTAVETDAAALRVQMNNLSGQSNGPLVSYSNLSIPAGQDYLIVVPGTYSSVSAMRAGFPVGIASVEGTVDPHNSQGTGTHTHTVIRIEGQAATSTIDTLTIS